ncbi:putative flavin-binding monooxygenase [Durotheca rogersii]|uniref:putative flavin-binding monooxygenase n=1 Tax=Durotheca rogersii TaxID=419775 RepID=UPI002220EA11|nr:putative flavin-binding monooxygenase [Durotheca rogersii]KAI5866334.1 putative flavin-binding monooxygenase [Durotheca rogersii]
MADDGCSFDVVIVGAGISGINCAYRLQTQHPQLRYVILEGRDAIGGTWDLFKFPGIRSDSDLHNYGFAWNKWPFAHPIAEGALITSYLKDSVSRFAIEEHIRLRHRVEAADWSSAARRWSFAVNCDGRPARYEGRWFVMATGYFDYERPREAAIPGLASFRGDVIHPQFWPPGYDYAGKKIAIIGSGSTAVTLLPSLAREAAEVTMVQRSPTYILPLDNSSRAPSRLRPYLPSAAFQAYERLWFLIVPYLFTLLYKAWPGRARAMLRAQARARLPPDVDADVHFRPRYAPFAQRMCIAPEGDFYAALHGRGRVASGSIAAVEAHGIRLADGRAVDADVIVTATGLRLRFGGAIAARVDGAPVAWPGRLMWNRAMLDGVPNLVFMFGYSTSPWTIGADNTAFYLCRLLAKMRRRGARVAVPQAPPAAAAKMVLSGLFNLSSTYVLEGNKDMPVYGDAGPWRPRIHPPIDWIASRWGDFTTDLRFS